MSRMFLWIFPAAAALGFFAVLLLGGALTAPQQRAVVKPATGLQLESVRIPKGEGDWIAAWFVQGQAGKPGILLLHGLRSNRSEMIGRAEFLHLAGYSLLLIDMQAHGETPGERITFGYRESIDAGSALNYLKTRMHGQKVGVIGVSLGGAAALLGDAPIAADAFVLEAVYTSIQEAIQNRLAIRFGKAGRLLSPLLVWQIEPRLGIEPESLTPVAAIRELPAPILIIAGTDDRHTLTEESKRLFQAAPEPKELWLVQGAHHQNFHRYAPAAYERKILSFFDKYLGRTGE
ncbi:alpha/beta hydrolase [Methylomonas sp. MgM2]